MECHYEIKGLSLTIYVPAELDHHAAKTIQQDVDSMIASYSIHTVIFDFENTEFMDSSGIGVIVGRCRNLSFSGGKVKAVNLHSARVRKIFTMAGLYKLIEVENG